MARIFRISTQALFCFLLASCATIDHGEFAVISVSPIDESKRYQKVETNVVGTDKAIYWALYAGTPKLDAAVQNALKKHNGNFMTNVKVKHTAWMIPVIYGESIFEVTGEIWRAEPK